MPLRGSFRTGWLPVFAALATVTGLAAESVAPLATVTVTNAVASAVAAPVTPSLLGPLVRMAGALALVLALLFGVQRWLRNGRGLAGRRGANARLNILEVKSLGQRHALFVVGYEQQRLLVATSPNGVSLLTPLPAAVPQTDEAPVPAVSFADALLQVVGRR